MNTAVDVGEVDVLTATFEELGVTLTHVTVPKRLDGEALYSVESFGTVLLPLTEEKREALAVYEHSQSHGKALILQHGNVRSVLATNIFSVYHKE